MKILLVFKSNQQPSNEIDRVIARAKVRELKCITVIFECDTRTSAKTVMAGNEYEISA